MPLKYRYYRSHKAIEFQIACHPQQQTPECNAEFTASQQKNCLFSHKLPCFEGKNAIAGKKILRP
jgi:hypothetical protein